MSKAVADRGSSETESAGLLVNTVSVDAVTASSAPPDKYHAVWLCCFLFGVGTLIPFNMLVSAFDFFQWLYAPRFPFEFFLPVFYIWPYFIMLIVMMYYGHQLNTAVRIIGCSAVVAGVMLGLPILQVCLYSESGQYQALSFWLTMGGMFIIGIMASIYASTVVSLAAQLPMHYIGAVMFGQGLAGVLGGGLRLLTKAIMPNTSTDRGLRDSTFVFFNIGTFLVLSGILGYLVIQRSRFAQYFVRRSATLTSATASIKSFEPVNVRAVVSKLWVHGLSVLLVFWVSLTLFPGVLTMLPPHASFWKQPSASAWFVQTLILLFQIGDMVGRMLPRWVQWPSPRWLWLPVVLRIAFVPLFILSIRPGLIPSDIWTFSLAILASLSNGYLSTLCMMAGPQEVNDHEREMAGNIMSFFLGLGIVLGVNSALLPLYGLKGCVINCHS